MMVIADISPHKGKLCRVLFEDGRVLWLHQDILLRHGLHGGDSLSMQQIHGLWQEAAEHRAYEYGLYLLERRPYSYRELLRKLMDAPKAQEAAVYAAMEKLVRYGFLDDARYAETLARHYVTHKAYGLRRAAYEMRHKGLEEQDIADALAPYDDPETISARLLGLLQKRYARQLADPDDRKARERVKAALLRLGYSYQEIRFALEDYDYAIEAEEE